MDPQTTWDELLEAWKGADWSQVIELAQSLFQWLDKGGFPPKTNSSELTGVDWDRFVARSTAEHALRFAKEAAFAEGTGSSPEPLLLSCVDCGAEGPVMLTEAMTGGWTSIEPVPSGNFLGRCPACS